MVDDERALRTSTLHVVAAPMEIRWYDLWLEEIIDSILYSVQSVPSGDTNERFSQLNHSGSAGRLARQALQRTRGASKPWQAR